MNVQLLIDSVVRETTVLIAQLATSGGLRAPLAHVANRVFLDLAAELERQGVSRKVSADMFGLALRGYQRRIQRLTESQTARGRSLWEAVLEHVSDGKVHTRAHILERFASDDDALVRGVLHDLTESGLLFCSGTGATAAYRAATPDELGDMRDALGTEGVDEVLWLVVFREGPVPVAALTERMKLSAQDLEASIARLIENRRLRDVEVDGERALSSGEFYVPLGATAGWTAAVLDHFQAVVRTIGTKLRGNTAGTLADRTGGSTYTFIVWPGHPRENEVLGELRRYRQWATALRTEIDAYNRTQTIPDSYLEVVSYAGQCTTSRHPHDAEVGDANP